MSARTGGHDRLGPPRPAQAATLILSSLTALTFLALAQTLGASPMSGASTGTPPASGRAALVRSFYAALNTALAGGDDTSLEALVAPDVVVHLPNRQFVGPAPLLAYATALGGASSGLRFEIEALIVDGDHAATTVDPVVPASATALGIVAGPAAPRRAEDRFRLAQGRIAEYWTTFAADQAPRALPPLPLRLWPGRKQAGLARLTFTPGSELADLSAADPHLLLAETGDLTVTLVGRATIARADALRAGWRPTGAEPLVLHPGDALLVPSGVTHTIRNATSAGASLLGFLLYGPDELATVQSHSTPDRVSRLLTMYAAARIDAPAIWKGGASVELLAQADDRCPADRAVLTIGWLALDPGQRLAAHAVDGVELLALETGSALSGAAPEGAMAVDQLVEVDPTLDQGAPSTAASQVLMAGDGLGASTGTSAPMAIAGQAPAQMILVTFAPPHAEPPLATPASPSPSGAGVA